MSCWVCGCKDPFFILLPEKENDFHIPIYKDTFVILPVDNMVFLYYVYCNKCMEMYLDNYPFDFKKLQKREIC